MQLSDEGVAADAPAPPPRDTPRWMLTSPTTLLVILALINFLNYVDRYVIAGVLPFLQDPVDGLGLNDDQTGWLGTAFMLVHSVASVPLGYLADRFLRKRLIAMGVALWSLATTLGAFVNTFGHMFIARAAVGVGEATYAPAATALISDRFTAKHRARVLGVFQLGMVLGSAAGLIAGGAVADRWGWRPAFLVVGIPGFILAVLVLLVYEAPPSTRRRTTTQVARLRIAPGEAASWSAAAWITAAGILTTFFTGALGFWAPVHILRTLYGGDKSHMGEVVLSFGPLGICASIAGVLVSSLIADRLERRYPGGGRLYTIAAGVLISAPFAAIAFLATQPVVLYVTLVLGVFFNVWYIGPILAALHDVVPPRLRATATGAYFLLIHLLGDAFSPVIVGKVGTATGSLSYGLLLATGLMSLAGFAALAALPASRRVAQLKEKAGGA